MSHFSNEEEEDELFPDRIATPTPPSTDAEVDELEDDELDPNDTRTLDEQIPEAIAQLSAGGKRLMILAVISSYDHNPPAQRYFRAPASIVAKRKKVAIARAKRKSASNRKNVKTTTEHDSDAENIEGRAAKKARTADDDQATTDKPEATAYVYVHPSSSAAAASTSRTRRGSKTTEAEPIQRGPFFFTLDDSFTIFKILLAQALPCRPESLVLNRIEWRFDKPANSKLKPLGDANGYKAMIRAIDFFARLDLWTMTCISFADA